MFPGYTWQAAMTRGNMSSGPYFDPLQRALSSYASYTAGWS